MQPQRQIGATLQADAMQRRRAFLRTLSGGAAVLGLPTLLAACGGGGSGTAEDGAGSGDGGGAGNGGAGAGVDTAARQAAIAGVESRCRELSQQALAPLAFVEAIAAHLRTQALYVAVGSDAATLTAWGEFADGRVHLITNNYRPVPRPAAALDGRATAAAATQDVPAASTARVLQTFGPDFDSADVVTELATWLDNVGYAVRGGQQAHVAALRQVAGDGYFYINTHGGAFQPTYSGRPMYSIQSSTMATSNAEADPGMRDDLDNRRLTYFTAHNGGVYLPFVEDWDTRFGITADFVEKYWRFEANSVVVINACSSARTAESGWAAGFVFACHKVGAGVYLGWNETVTPPGAYRAAKYFTDRLLGANQFQAEMPAQRPFAWDVVMGDMQKKGVHVDPNNGATFLALPKPASVVKPVLAPSIHHVEADEYLDELKLYGQFGDQQGEVSIDGVVRHIRRWEAEHIVCDLPATGKGSCGPVQVKVRGLKSNLRQLTEWTLPLDYTWIVMEAQGLKLTGVSNIRLRADVAGSREAPGDAPIQPVRYTIATRESNLPLTASGSYPAGQCSIDWSGSATYVAIPPAGYRHILMAYLKVDTAARRGSLGLALGAPTPDFTQSGCTTSHFQAIFGPLNEQVSYPSPVANSTDLIPLHSLSLPFDENYGIAADTYSTVLVRLKWNPVSAHHPPLPTDGV